MITIILKEFGRNLFRFCVTISFLWIGTIYMWYIGTALFGNYSWLSPVIIISGLLFSSIITGYRKYKLQGELGVKINRE